MLISWLGSDGKHKRIAKSFCGNNQNHNRLSVYYVPSSTIATKVTMLSQTHTPESPLGTHSLVSSH